MDGFSPQNGFFGLSGLGPGASSGPTVAEQIAALFGNGEEGGVYRFFDETTLYQDSARTTPVTAPGQPCFSATDLSGNDNHLSQNAGTPRWQGMPATWGANLATSPLFEEETDWTGGTGWAWSGTVWTKTAGVAASLSQAVSLTAGKTYMVVMRVATRTAGTVKMQLTGGTTVTHASGYNAAGEYIELLTAVSGNNTVGILADSAFAGTLKACSIFEVTSFRDMGVYGDFAERLKSAAIDMSATNEMTIVIALTRGRRQANMLAGQVGATATGNGERLDIQPAGYGFTGRDGTNVDLVTTNDPNMDPFGGSSGAGGFGIFSCRRDTGEAAIADQHQVRINGLTLAQANSAGPFTSPTANPNNATINLLAWINNNSFFCGYIHGTLIINRRLTDEELAIAERLCAFDGKYLVGLTIGDSTWDADAPAQGVNRGLTSNTNQFTGAIGRMMRLENWGDDTLEQEADFDALTTTALDQLTTVHIGQGLNDVAGRVDSGASLATIQSDYQDLLDKAATACPSASIIGSLLPPVNDWLTTGRTNPEDCEAAYTGWNAGLQDDTITGLDGVATQHIAVLDDGTENLIDIYNTGPLGVGDNVHPGELGRLVMGTATWAVHVSRGELAPARTFA